MHSLARTKLARRLRLQPVIYLGLVALLLGSVGVGGSRAVATHELTSQASLLNNVTRFSTAPAGGAGFAADPTFFPVSTQSEQAFSATAVTIASPTLVYPGVDDEEEIMIRRPYLNLRNLSPGTYTYDFQIATDASFSSASTVASVTGHPRSPNPNGYNITYWQSDVALAEGTTHFWRARARSGTDDTSPWSTVASFRITDDAWLGDGEEWRIPLPDVARLSGTFNEAYHAGTIGRLHGGIDFSQHPNLCHTSVRAVRNGILSRAEAGHTNYHTVALLHPDPDQKTHYLHMDRDATGSDLAPTALPLGTYINQGTVLGVMSNAGPRDAADNRTLACHLHFGLSNPEGTEYYNPLQLFYDRQTNTWPNWGILPTTPPIVNAIYLRAGRNLAANSTGINTPYVIAKVVDPTVPVQNRNAVTLFEGQRNAPYQVRFLVNGAIPNRGPAPDNGLIQFDTLAAGQQETDYYAYRDSDTGPRSLQNNDPFYLMYFRWTPSGSGPQTIRVEARDYQMANARVPPTLTITSTNTVTIGPELKTSDNTAIDIDGCTPQPRELTLRLFNRNSNFTGVTADTYTLRLEQFGLHGSFLNTTQVTIGEGQSRDISLTINPPSAGQAGRPLLMMLRIVATSSIVTSVYDDLVVDVNVRECNLFDRLNRLFGFDASIGLEVDENGRFNIGAAPDLLTGEATAASWSLSHGWPGVPGSSFTTLRVDGRNYIYGSGGTVLSAPANTNARSNRSVWQFGKIEIAQTLQLTRTNPLDLLAPEDAVAIVYTVRNTDSVAHSVGMRVLLDTDIGSSAQQFRVGGNAVTSERAYAGAAIPDALQVTSDLAPTRSAAAILRGPGVTVPDRLILASWTRLSPTTYDYTANSTRPISQDGAYALYWDSRPLGPGESRTYITRYGRASSGAPAVSSVRR